MQLFNVLVFNVMLIRSGVVLCHVTVILLLLRTVEVKFRHPEIFYAGNSLLT
jgi:hypothetical protein